MAKFNLTATVNTSLAGTTLTGAEGLGTTLSGQQGFTVGVLNGVGATGPQGPRGAGFTGGSYDSSNGTVTFTSDDGLEFSTGDLRGADGTGSGTVTSVEAGGGLTGGPVTSSGTISHADTSTQANITATANTYVDGLTFDTYGHVTGVTTVAGFDGDYNSLTSRPTLGTAAAADVEDFDIDLDDTTIFSSAGVANRAVRTDAGGKVVGHIVQAGADGVGVAALTYNDGGGSCNLTFNHVDQTPDFTGNAGRITVNTDVTTNPYMLFMLEDNVTAGVNTGTIGTYMRVYQQGIDVTGAITDTSTGAERDVRLPYHAAGVTTLTEPGVYYRSNNNALTFGAVAAGTVMTIYNNTANNITLNRGSTVTVLRKGNANNNTNNASATLGPRSTTTVTAFQDNWVVVTGTDVS